MDGEEQFSVHKKEGIFRCFKCETTGNVYSFLTKLHAQFLEVTTQAHYEALASKYGLPWRTLKAAGLAYDEDIDRWLFPSADGSKFLNNLGVLYPSSRKLGNRVLKAPELPVKLWRPFDKKKLSNDVWVFEGESDLLAARAALKAAGMKAMPSLVSTSGSTTWTDAMIRATKGKNLVFFWDNDPGGQDKGVKAITKRVKGATFSFVNWEPYKDVEPRVKDVRDLWITRKARKATVATELFDLASNVSHTETVESSDEHQDLDIDDIEEITEYSKYREGLTKDLYLNESMRMSYDIVMAACLSINLPDKPVPILLVGSPSTGKSVLVDAFGKTHKYFHYETKLTAENLVSGYKDGTGKNYSIASKAGNKTVFIGDLTVILSMPATEQIKLWGHIRELYMGYYKASFGNQDARIYKDKMNFIAGVTHAIYSVNESDMGERFVKLDFAGPDFDEHQHTLRALQLQDTWKEVEANLMASILGYYKHLAENTNFSEPPKIPEDIQLKIINLANLATKLRTKVVKDRWEGLMHRPSAESPARFATLLNTEAKALLWVTQSKEVTPYIYSCLRKIAFDSCPGLGLEVILFIHRNKSATVSKLVRELSIPKTRIQQLVTDFTSLKILTFTKGNNGSGNRGRDVHHYILTDPIRASLDDISPRKPKGKPTRKKSTSRFKTRPKKKSSQ